jgi:hypothetical protein
VAENNKISYLEIQEKLEELWKKEEEFLISINVEPAEKNNANSKPS